MFGVVLSGNSRIEVREFPDPEPEAGEALVRMAASALCGTDLRPYRSPEGSAGALVGHEMVGEVTAVNQTRYVSVGDRVAIHVAVGCGRCYYCSRGELVHCPDITFRNGGHAELIAVPEACCLGLPDDVSWERGALLGGDTIGTTYHALKRLGVSAFDTVAVLGCGPVGLGMLSVLRFLGARAIAVDMSAYRRALAEKLGAWRAVDPNGRDAAKEILELTGGAGADVALDCSPAPATVSSALDCVRSFGRVAFVGEKGDATIHPSNHFIRKEITAIGSWYYTANDYFEILDLHARGLKVDDLITHRFPLREADEAFATFASGESGKVLLTY